LIELVDLVFRTSRGLPATMAQEFPLMLSPDNCGDLYIIRADDRIVSHVGLYRQIMVCDGIEVPVACLGAVCTHPQYRGRGLAGQLTDLAIERARQKGCLLMPISGSRSLYTRRGACTISPTYQLAINAEHLQPAEASRFTTGPYRQPDLPELLALQRQQRVRYRWQGPEVPILLRAHLELGCSAWTARDAAGALAGFLLVRHAGPMAGRDRSTASVVLHLGRPETLPSLAATALQKLSLSALLFTALPGEDQLLAALRTVGAQPDLGSSGWTVKILDLAGLVERFKDRFARVGELSIRVEADTLVIGLDGQDVALADQRQVCAALFNGPSAWPPMLKLLSAEQQRWLRQVLPLPVANYGVNFI
ncbi:MAG: GNAT family N-acetyltransferase, partial [Phycisphaerae bacterium]